jgi:UDP-4-amino-4,6-dideoxy-N-acetyl-beta-L-altrosamine transaminase
MKPVADTKAGFLPYGRQCISEDDIAAVVNVLRSDWLTQGPSVTGFEQKLAAAVGARHAVACSSGTAALHMAMLALGIGPGDTVVTTPNTFLADANCAKYVGAGVQFADVDPATGNIDPAAVALLLESDRTRKIKAIIPVSFAGQPANLPDICSMARSHGAAVVSDACHSLGASYDHAGVRHTLGGSAHDDMTVFSFHPVKHVAMGEGGAVTTDDDDLAARLRTYRNHGMTREAFSINEQALSPEGEVNPWYYEMQRPGYNYRLSDIHAALGISQLSRLSESLCCRNEIAQYYRNQLKQRFPDGRVRTLECRENVHHAYHLFVLQVDFSSFGVSRARVMNQLRESGIGTQVHYIPVHLQPYYRSDCGTGPGDFPNAEAYYEQALSIPMYPELTERDCDRVLDRLQTILLECGR